MGEEILDQLETQDQAQMRFELGRNREMRESGRTLASITEEIEGEEKSEDTDSDKK